jgi:hypothetical protein
MPATWLQNSLGAFEENLDKMPVVLWNVVMTQKIYNTFHYTQPMVSALPLLRGGRRVSAGAPKVDVGLRRRDDFT